MAEHKLYLTTGPDREGRGLVAVITRGHPAHGDKNATVLTVEVVADQDATEDWYRQMLIEQPWQPRN